MLTDRPIGIIAAMKIEAEGLIAHMTEAVTETISGITFTAGKLGGKSCVVAVCGIGKVFAALCAQTMILRYQPSLIINSGVAGSLSSSLQIGSIAIASTLVQHDMDTSALGDPVGLISGINVVHLPCDKASSDRLADCAEKEAIPYQRGTIASGDRFLSENESKNWIAHTFDAIACEMEGAAIGQVCYVNTVPCAVMRAISDGGDEDAAIDYPTFMRMAAERAVRVLLRFFAQM